MDPTAIPWDKLTLTAALGIAVMAFVFGWVVPRYVYLREVKEKNEQTTIAKHALTALSGLLPVHCPLKDRDDVATWRQK